MTNTTKNTQLRTIIENRYEKTSVSKKYTIKPFLEKLANYEDNNGLKPDLRLAKRWLTNKDLSLEEAHTVVNHLIINGYIIPDEDPEIQENGEHKDDTQIEGVLLEEYKKDYNLVEFKYSQQQIYDEEINQSTWIEEYADYLVNQANKVQTIIKTEHGDTSTDKKVKMIYVWNPDEQIWEPDQDQVKQWLQNKMPKLATKRTKNELVDKVKHKDPIPESEAGVGEGKIAVKNGILDLETRELRDIRKKDYVTNKLPVKYDEDAEAPVFKQYLNDSVMDQQNRDKLQEYAGSILRPEWTDKLQKAMICLGPTDSGKSVFIQVIQSLVGKRNYSTEDLNALADEDHTQGQLMGKLANTNAELSTKIMERRDKIKGIIAGDSQTVNIKFENRFKYKPTCKHLYGANETPDLSDSGNNHDPFFNRFLVAEFPKTIPKSEQDNFLVEKIEDELSGVLNWALDGMERLEENEFQFTAQRSPVEVKKKWREYGNSIDKFIAEFIETRNEVRKRLKENGYTDDEIIEEFKDYDFAVTLDYAYEVYDQFCMVTGREQYQKNKLSQELNEIQQSIKKRMNSNGNRGTKFEKIRMINDPTKKIKEISNRESAKGVDE